MRRYISFGVTIVLMFAVQFGWAQENPRTRELQAQLEEIQEKLRAAARSNDPNSKVTELGSSRARQREEDMPRLVIRLYDLSDLFAVAPPYVAKDGGELDRDASEVFAGFEPVNVNAPRKRVSAGPKKMQAKKRAPRGARARKR